MSNVHAFDWDMLMRFGLGVMGFAPDDFWKMTPGEFEAAVRGRLGQIGEKAALGRGDLSALMARFPDAGGGHG